jgi:hypothetical protein
VFIGQHATSSCCRRFIKKWHGIEKGSALFAGFIQVDFGGSGFLLGDFNLFIFSQHLIGH